MKYLSTIIMLLAVGLLCAHNADDAVLGITSTHISKEKAKKLNWEYPYGSRIDRIYPDSPAEMAGLGVMDYIYGLDGERVSKNRSLEDMLDEHQPGDQVQLSYLRAGQPLTVSLQLVRRGDLQRPHTPDGKDPFLGIDFRYEDKKTPVDGALFNVVHNSTAEAMGLQDGDILTAIDDYPVLDWHDASPLINNRQVGDPITVTVYRKGTYQTVTRPIKSEEATRKDHSRPNGPNIITADPDSPVAEATLTVPMPTEIPTEISLEEPVAAPVQEPTVSGLSMKAINIFPNPNTGIFDLEFTLSSEGETAVNIYNPTGQMVYFNTLGNFSGTFSDRIDIANGVRGIYFLQIRQGTEQLIRKVVLQ